MEATPGPGPGPGPRCEQTTFSNSEGGQGNETWLQSSQEGHSPLSAPREQKSFDFKACGEMARSPAGKARQGQVRRWPVNSYLLQEVLLHRLRQSTAPVGSLDTSCHPYPCSEAILAVYWDDFNFCSEFISLAVDLISVGGQEARGCHPDPTRNSARMLIPASRGC